MNRREAIQFLHDRHSDVIHAPGEDVDLETFHLDVFWFQGHTCNLMDSHSKRVKRCFATIHHLLVKGDAVVRDAVFYDCLQHLVFHPDLEWAKKRMPPLLAEACDKTREALDQQFGAGERH